MPRKMPRPRVGFLFETAPPPFLRSCLATFADREWRTNEMDRMKRFVCAANESFDRESEELHDHSSSAKTRKRSPGPLCRVAEGERSKINHSIIQTLLVLLSCYHGPCDYVLQRRRHHRSLGGSYVVRKHEQFRRGERLSILRFFLRIFQRLF